MSANSSIEWTDRTWNPVRGCSVISPGCHNCYAMKMAHRFSGDGKAYAGLTKLTEPSGPQWTGKIATIDHALLEPLSWRKPAKVFVNSMSDLFHDHVPVAFIARVFAVMRGAPNHTFQVLTKRAERMRSILEHPDFEDLVDVAADDIAGENQWCHLHDDRPWPLSNVWLGVSVENQKYADERIPHLLQTPASMRFLSVEPLLGAVNLRGHFFSNEIRFPGRCHACGNGHGFTRCSNYGSVAKTHQRHRGGPIICEQFVKEPGVGIDWVIVGGESGHGARPFDIVWARSIVKQCADAGVACFVKQVGRYPQLQCSNCEGLVGRGVTGGFVDSCGSSHGQLIGELLRIRDSKGGDIAEWPEDLRVRQFPVIARKEQQ